MRHFDMPVSDVSLKPSLYFGASSGRTATMALANAFNLETNSICLHEGKFRKFEKSGEKVLDFLTLENRLAYEFPDKRAAIIEEKRGFIDDIARRHEAAFFGDIAYNNVPFICNLADKYSDAKFLFVFRDCLSFVASAAAEHGIDETPVGWPPNDKVLSDVEKFISLGRWQPKANSPEAELWEEWSYRSKNIWLWAETNRVLLEEAGQLPSHRFMKIKFEDFSSDTISTYSKMRDFIGFKGSIPDTSQRILLSRINHRKRKTYRLTFNLLTRQERNVYEKYAVPILKRLKYHE